MIHIPNFRKAFALSGGLVVLLALGVVVGLTVVRVQNQKGVVGRPKATGIACNTDVSLSISPSPIAPNGSVVFGVASGDASTWIQNVWNGTTTGGNSHPGVNIYEKCGCVSLGGNACDSDSTTCTAAWSGNYTWTRYWKHCEGNFQNCSDWCSVSKQFTVSSSGGGSCPATINGSASPSTVSSGGTMNVSFSSSYGYTNVGISGIAGCGGVTVSGGPTWTWTCHPTNSGTARFFSTDSPNCNKDVSYTVSGNSGGASYTATDPIGGKVVSSLTPTFTWTANTAGISYNNICIGTDATCNNLKCGWSPSTSDRSYALPASANLLSNTTYYWTIYGQPGWPAPGSGCQSFKTPVVSIPTHFECVSKACKKVDGDVANKNGCSAEGGTCCGSNSDCASGQVCDTTTVPNSCKTATASHFECVSKACASVSGAGDNKNGCTAVGGACCSNSSDCVSGQTCDVTTTPNSCVTDTSEVNACWGNGGNNGRCYDCNGDGVVNILDFSCFAKKWRANI